MTAIFGDTLIFTDIHFGLKNNSISRLNICIKIIKELCGVIKKRNIKNVIFVGDWHHSRNLLDVQTANVSAKCLNALTSLAHVYLILGNHDIYNKMDSKINSIVIFESTKNLTIVKTPMELELNGKKVLLCPWLSKYDGFQKNSYDYLIGHFDISERYIKDSYIKDHSIDMTSSESDVNKELGLTDTGSTEDEDMDFVEFAKPTTGIVLSGHIHKHKTFMLKSRKVIFIGSPYQQTMGDINDERGYYIHTESDKLEFHEINDVPKHIELKMSDIQKDIDNFDYSIVTGNIIQKIYDVQLKESDNAKILQKIHDNNPYEELMSIYDVSDNMVDGATSAEESEFVAMLRKSKLDYIHKYVDNIDDSTLSGNMLNRVKLMNYLTDYYNKVVYTKGNRQ